MRHWCTLPLVSAVVEKSWKAMKGFPHSLGIKPGQSASEAGTLPLLHAGPLYSIYMLYDIYTGCYRYILYSICFI